MILLAMCIKRPKKITLLCLILLFTSFTGYAISQDQDQINFDKSEKQILFTDEDVTIKELALHSAKWTVTADRLNFGLRKEALWVKIAVKNRSDHPNWYLEIQNSQLDKISVHLLGKDYEVIETFEGGDHLPFHERVLLDHQFVFPLHLVRNMQYYIVIKVKTEGSLQVPIRLTLSDLFYSSRQHRYFVESFFIGLFLILILLNLFHFMFSQDRTKIYYIAYLVAFVLFEFSMRGSIFHWLVYDYGDLNRYFIPLLLQMMSIFASLSTIHFLKIKRHSKLLHAVLRGFVALASVVVVLIPFISYNFAIILGMVTLTLVCLFTLIASMYMAKTGQKEARQYLIAWLPALIGLLIMAFQKAGLIANNDFTENSALVGNAFQALALAYVMSIKLLQDRSSNQNMDLILHENHQKRSAAVQLIHQFFQYQPDNFPELTIKTEYNDILLQKGSQTFLMEVEKRRLFIVNVQIQSSDVASMFLFSQIAGFLYTGMKKVLRKKSSKDILDLMEKQLLTCEDFAKKRRIMLEISLFYLNADRRHLYGISRGGRNYLVRDGRLKDLQKYQKQSLSLQENDLLVFKTLKAGEQQGMVEIRLLAKQLHEMLEKSY